MTADCKACDGTWPSADHWIGDCGLSQAFLVEDQFFLGWTVLVLKRHETELFRLSVEERRRLIEEVSAVACVLAEVYQARKINYELLGNQLPHIHWHLIPRSPQDQAPSEPVWRVGHDAVRLEPQTRAAHLSVLRRGLTSRLPEFRSDGQPSVPFRDVAE